VILRAQLTNKGGILKPGMFARVRLLLSENADAVVIPEQSLVPQGDEQFVFKVIEGKAVRTKVEIGTRRDGRVEITNGLALGETVVVAGWQRLRDGASVRIAGGRPPAGADGKPADAKPSEGKPGEGKSMDGKTGTGRAPSEGKPEMKSDSEPKKARP
jgi:membrane fusion protein, multidrug efflux system